MKRIAFLCLAGTFLLASCAEKKPDDAAASATKVVLPYEASYSSSFEMGNAEYAKMILQGSWKDWEENNLDNMKNWMADTIVAIHSDTRVVKGVDSLMARWKKGRATYSTVKTTIDAVMPVYSTDKKENWVLVWATEIDTKLDGTVDTVVLMETWRINTAGKADLLLQFDRKEGKE